MATALLPGVGYVQPTAAGTFLLPGRGYVQEEADGNSGSAALSISQVTVAATGVTSGSLQTFPIPGWGYAQEDTGSTDQLPGFGYLRQSLSNVSGFAALVLGSLRSVAVTVEATGTIAGSSSGSQLPPYGYVQQTSNNSNLVPGYGYVRENVAGGLTGSGTVSIAQAVVAGTGAVIGGNVSGTGAISIAQAIVAAAGTLLIDDRGTPPEISISSSVVAGGQEVTIDGDGAITLPSLTMVGAGRTPIFLQSTLPSLLVVGTGVVLDISEPAPSIARSTSFGGGGAGFSPYHHTSLSRARHAPGVRQIIEQDDEMILKLLMKAVTEAKLDQ